MINNASKTKVISIFELFVLLILPLPFLHLNVFYVILALLITFLSKYIRKESWSDYGFVAVRQKELILSVMIGIILGFIDNYLTEPLITRLSGAEPDLSSYEGMKGSLSGLIGMLALGWVVGGLFEEFFFRGYLFFRFNTLIHYAKLYRFTAIVVTSIVFGFAHNYQGIGGIIGTLIFSVVMGLLYFFFKRNVWYLIMIHGFYDTVGIFRLYLGQ